MRDFLPINPLEAVPEGRDSAAFATEKYLRLIEQDGVYQLSIKPQSAGIRLRFAGQTADAETLDAALLRLGKMLLGLPAFRQALSKAVIGAR